MFSILKKNYKPKQFWNNWSENFAKDPWQKKVHSQHKWLLKKALENDVSNILEVGCGFGRNIKFLIKNGINPSNISGCDISENMINLAKKHIRTNVNLVVSKAEKLPYKTNEYSLVFTHGVLMHISKENVVSSIEEIKRVSGKYILTIEQNYEADNNYTFVHDYKKLFKEANVEIVSFEANAKLGLDLTYGKIRT